MKHVDMASEEKNSPKKKKKLNVSNLGFFFFPSMKATCLDIVLPVTPKSWAEMLV